MSCFYFSPIWMKIYPLFAMVAFLLGQAPSHHGSQELLCKLSIYATSALHPKIPTSSFKVKDKGCSNPSFP